ncbi:MAG: efflux RND transporter permease subunit [Dehalococcoidia bacterium]|nr:efflux RND transporter permease subunit [Dehalococcoidia bacterium]
MYPAGVPGSGFCGDGNADFTVWSGGYRILLQKAIAVRWLPVLTGVSMLGMMYLFLHLRIVGTEFAPPEDNNQLSVSISMPAGTAVQSTNEAVTQVEAKLRDLPEVRTLFTSIGGGGFGGSSERNGNIAVGLVEKGERSRSVFDIQAVIRQYGAGIPGAQVRTSVPSPLIGGGGTPVTVIIRGDDPPTLQGLTTRVLDIVKNTPGAVEARTSTVTPSPEYRAIVDQRKAADQGVTAQTIANTLRAAVQGILSSELRPEGKDQVDIVLQLQNAETMTLEQLAAIPIVTSKRTIVRLDQVATIVPATSPGQISRSNRAREAQVLSNVSGRSIGDVLRDITSQTDQIQLPLGYTIQMSGQGSQIDTAFSALGQAMVLSIILMYMLMAALYESLIYPFAVLLCLPVALVGAVVGLILTGSTINIFSMIGMIMLVGLVAKNAILLVDYTNTLRARGMSRNDALIEAGPTRLRPILMTTMTLICAMIPLALKLGAGAESRSPMAVVVLGGIISSTLLTLVLVPCAYTYLDDIQNWILRRRQPREAEVLEEATALLHTEQSIAGR